jgi:hypothetical protein
MKLQAIVSSVALAAALALASPAQAQSYMLGGVEIPTDQVQDFQDKCAALRAESTASLTTDETNAVDPTETGSVGGEIKSGSDDPASQDNWAEALASLTLEQCDASGFADTM